MNDDDVEIVQEADGRWRWVVRGTPAEAGSVAFRRHEDAALDRQIHARAALDATGRRVLPKEHLRRLISAIALPCAECADVFFGGVYWYRRDAQGCNWGVAIMNGHGDRDGCQACVHAGQNELRRRYAIADEA